MCKTNSRSGIYSGAEDADFLAIEGAIAGAGQTLKELDWFEVKEIRGNIQDGKVAWYQVKLGIVKLGIGFCVLNPADLHRE